MGVQFTEFKAMRDHYLSLPSVEIFLRNLLAQQQKEELKQETTIVFIEKIRELTNNCFREFVDEMNFNVAGISTDGQLKRYLTFLAKECRSILYRAQNEILDGKEIVVNNVSNTAVATLLDDYLDVLVRDREQLVWLVYEIDEIATENNIQLPKGEELKDSGELIEPLTLPATRHKLVLLYELGIFDNMYKKYFNSIGKGQFVELIRVVLNLPDDVKTVEALRSDIGKLLKGNRDEPPLTPRAKHTVKMELYKIGIEAKNLN